jgi:hypothetical protein
VFVSPRRDARAARRFFQRAIGTTRITPVEVVADHAPVYPGVLWGAGAGRLASNRPGRQQPHRGRPRPTEGTPLADAGLKQDRSARIVITGHAFIQKRSAGHYELAIEEPARRRVAATFDELALAI